MRSIFLLHAVAVAVAVAEAFAGDERDTGPAVPVPRRRRSLSQSLLQSFYTKARPKVDRCWGEIEVDDETGDRRPAIKCDFIVPKHYNGTSRIQRGSCRDFLHEPICGEIADDDCAGSFVLSGKIRTALYPDVVRPETMDRPNPPESHHHHAYCARADIYRDVDDSGRQTNVAHASAELLVSFRGAVEYSLDVEEESAESDGDSTVAAFAASLVGILVVVPVAALLFAKRRRGVAKVRHLMEKDADADADTDKVKVQTGDIEIV